jgi:hypothetical protein
LQHLLGKQHLTNDAASNATYQRYLDRPGASQSTSADSCDVVRAWSSDELSMLPMRATCLSPSTILGQLSEYEGARVWKYVSEVRENQGLGKSQGGKRVVSVSVSVSICVCVCLSLPISFALVINLQLHS